MRIVIKGADFSQVSIGKVVKDLSFVIDSNNYDVKFLNPPSVFPAAAGTGYNTGTTVYNASNGAEDYVIQTNNVNRFVTDFIEVSEGMTIVGVGAINATNTPSVVCFDASKNPIVPVNTTTATWTINNNGDFSFTVPSGVSFIKIQVATLLAVFNVVGNMP